MAASSATELLARVKAFNAISTQGTSSLDPTLRKELHEATRQLSYKLEEPVAAVQRLTVGQPATSTVLKVALDIGVFPVLAEGNRGKSLAELTEGTGASSELLLRLLRFLFAVGVVHENEGSYTLAPTCDLLGDAATARSAKACVDLITPMFNELPGLIKDSNWCSPVDRLNGAAARAFNSPGKDVFQIIMEQDKSAAEGFGHFLSAMSKNSSKMQEVYPVDERLIQGYRGGKDEFLWIDVGGGMGQYTLALKQAFPDLPGRFLVQEQETMVKIAQTKGYDQHLEFMTHDFFTEQPIKGARTYYFRECFHNWQDKNCRVILGRIRDAMEPGYSRLLIHETIMPKTHATESQVTLDWMMMCGYSTLERSEEQWYSLIESVGLKISNIYSKPTVMEGVIEIIKV